MLFVTSGSHESFGGINNNQQKIEEPPSFTRNFKNKTFVAKELN